MVYLDEIQAKTRGDTDVLDITPEVEAVVGRSGIRDGVATIFVSGSTAGLTTIEYEPGLIADLKEAFDRIAPSGGSYHHDSRWGDGNGYAHVRAAMLGASLAVPVRGGRLFLGTWQQIVMIDFDNRPRSRTISVLVMGE